VKLQAGKIGYGVRYRPLDYLLGSRAPMWWVLRTTFGATIILLYFTWWLSHPTWGVDIDELACPSTLSYELWLTGVCTVLPDRHYSNPS
jgi:hypothetical protein